MSEGLIIAKMELDGSKGSLYPYIPYVLESNHPRFVKGTRLDWGFVHVALCDGYDLKILANEYNRATCPHARQSEWPFQIGCSEHRQWEWCRPVNCDDCGAELKHVEFVRRRP